ncbi:MAG: hypothetical protein ACYDCF_04585 [Burkholderiales bacterium]
MQPSKPKLYFSNAVSEGGLGKSPPLNMMGLNAAGKTPTAASLGIPKADPIAMRSREQNERNARARTIRTESRRIEKMQDSLNGGGLDTKTQKALRVQIDKARETIATAKAEHEQSEMARIKTRAEERDRGDENIP